MNDSDRLFADYYTPHETTVDFNNVPMVKKAMKKQKMDFGSRTSDRYVYSSMVILCIWELEISIFVHWVVSSVTKYTFR